MRVVGGLEVPGGKRGEIGAFVTEICPGGVVDTHGEVQEGLHKEIDIAHLSVFDCYAEFRLSTSQAIEFWNGMVSGCAENRSKKCRALSLPPAEKSRSSSAGMNTQYVETSRY